MEASNFLFLHEFSGILKGSIKYLPWFGQLLILFGIYLIGEYLFALLTVFIINAIYPDLDFLKFITSFGNIKSLDDISLDQERSIKIYQFGTSLGRFIIVALLFIYLCGESAVKSLSLNKFIKPVSILTMILLVIASGFIISIVHEWNQALHLPGGGEEIEKTLRNFEDQALLQTQLFLRTTVFAGFIVNLIIIGFLAAIGEEIFFRGVLQNLFFKGTRNAHAAIWISAFIFSFIHLQFFGFFPRLLMGALLGYLYYFSGSLWSAIIAHFINNAATVIAYYLLNKGIIETNVAESSSVVGAIIAIPFVFLLLRYFMRTETPLSLPDGKRLDFSALDERQDESNIH